jgi:hypothetical protein
MKTVRRAVILGSLASLLLAPLALAQDVTDAEFKCMQGLDKASAKFVGSKTKCALKCFGNAWKVPQVEPFSDCDPPYSGLAANCIIDDPAKPAKSAEEQFSAAILKICDPASNPKNECPDCFSGKDCSNTGEATNRVQFVEGQIDTFGPLVFCERPSATKDEQKCQLNTAKVLSKYAAATTKCYDKCQSSLRKGTADGTCDPPSPSDTATVACISKAQGKAIPGVDKLCTGVPAPKGPSDPECQTTTACTSASNCPAGAFCDTTGFCASHYLTGAQFVNLVDLAISNTVPTVYCGD